MKLDRRLLRAQTEVADEWLEGEGKTLRTCSGRKFDMTDHYVMFALKDLYDDPDAQQLLALRAQEEN